MPDKQVIALSLCAEAMGIDTENYFFYKFRTDYRDDFPPAHITRYNKCAKPWPGGPPDCGAYRQMVIDQDQSARRRVPEGFRSAALPLQKVQKEDRTHNLTALWPVIIKHNGDRTIAGLGTRIIAMVTGLTLLQGINKLKGRPINHIKHALAFQPLNE